jgi:hypothetical protein
LSKKLCNFAFFELFKAQKHKKAVTKCNGFRELIKYHFLSTTSQWPPESKAAGGIVIEKYFTRVPKARHPSNSTQTNIVSAVWSGQCVGNQRAIGTPQKDGMMSSVLPARLSRCASLPQTAA